jgi:hypothetical protein
VVQPQCGSVTFVQRFGSLNLHVHFHVLVLDGIFAKDARGRVTFHPAPPPQPADVENMAERLARRSTAWLRRHGYLDVSTREAHADELAQTALEACADIAMGRGAVATLPRVGEDTVDRDAEPEPAEPALVAERHGFNVHAGVCIAAGDFYVTRRRLERRKRLAFPIPSWTVHLRALRAKITTGTVHAPARHWRCEGCGDSLPG